MRESFVGMAWIVSAGCHAVLGFEEGSPREDVTASSGASSSDASSGSIIASSAVGSSASSSTGGGGGGASTSTGGGGSGGTAGEGGGGAGGAEPATCETSEPGEPWAVAFGDVALESRIRARFGLDDAVVLAGHFRGAVDFGEGFTLEHPSSQEGFVAMLDGERAPVFAVEVAGSGDDAERFVNDVAVSPDGAIAVAGVFNGMLELDGLAPVDAAGGDDGFLARLGPTGSFTWRTPLPGAGAQRVTATAIGPMRAIVAGGTRGVLDLDGETLDAGGVERAFVASFDADDGSLLEATLTTLSGNIYASDLAVSGGGDVLVGHASEPLGNGGVARVNRNDGEIWGHEWAGATVVAVVASDEGWFAGGFFEATIDLDRHTATAAGGEYADAFVARIDPDTGVVTWLESFGGQDVEALLGLAVGCDGRLIISFTTTGSVDIAGRTFPTSGTLDFIVARLDPETGEAVSAARFGAGGLQAPFSLVAQGGTPLLAGGFEQGIDFGFDTVETGTASFFVVEAPLAPAGD